MSKQKGNRAAAEQAQYDEKVGRKLRLHNVPCAAKGCGKSAVVHVVVGWCSVHEPKG